MDELKKKSRIIIDRITSLDCYKKARVLMIYVDFRGEVQTRELIERSLSEGKRVSVPVCITRGRILVPSEIKGIDELKPGVLGIPEPDREHLRPLDPAEPDLFIVPGLAFDKSCSRIGFGAGYYDRFLPNTKDTALKVGIAFSFQIIEHIPTDEYDVPMDMVITESGIISRL